MQKQRNNKLYSATIHYYNDYCDKDLISRCYIFAISYADACSQIDTQFSDIERIDIEEIAGDCGPTAILYVPDDSDVITAINNENDY